VTQICRFDLKSRSRATFCGLAAHDRAIKDANLILLLFLFLAAKVGLGISVAALLRRSEGYDLLMKSGPDQTRIHMLRYAISLLAGVITRQ
jgi:hypothetical protein